MRKQLDEVQRYLVQIAPIMRLDHWSIMVTDELPDEGAHADAWTHPRYDAVTIRFGTEFLTEFSAEQQRWICVHELGHAIGRGVDELLDSLVLGVRNMAISDQADDAVEKMIDHFTRIIMPFIPLPQWEWSKKESGHAPFLPPPHN